MFGTLVKFSTTIIVQVVSWHHLRHCVVVKCLSLVGLFDAFEIKTYGRYLLRRFSKEANLIQDRLLMDHSRQECYEDRRVHDLEFIMGNEFYLKFHQ